MKEQHGFTLIELLVVIAIIGVLSAVVLGSLNTARNKARDSTVKSNIDSVRTQAQIYLGDNNSYGVNLLDESDCHATDNLFSDTTITAQVQAAEAANGPTAVVTCNVAADGAAFAVSAELMGTPGTYYCVDSTGVGKTSNTALGTNTAC